VLDAAAEIGDGAGKRFDPKLVEAFRKGAAQMRKVLGEMFPTSSATW